VPRPRNERLLPLFAAFSYPFAAVPFLYFWFLEHGLDLAAYGRLVAIYYATMVVAEVPTGLLADRLGRRLCMVLGPALLAASFGVFWAWRSEGGFACGEVLFGLGHALLSGAPAALLYDSLAERDEVHRFMAREGAVHAARLHGTGLAFLAGGLVASVWGLGATLPLTAVLCLVASVTACCMREPRPTAATTHRTSLASDAWRALRQRDVLWITAYFVLLFCLLRYGFHNYQPYLDLARDTLQTMGGWWPLAVGAMFFGLNIVAAECSRAAPWMLQRVGRRRLLWAMPLMMSAGIGFMALPLGLWGAVLLLAQQVPFGMHWPVVQDLVNHRVPSRTRTTVLSAVSLLGRLGFALAAWPLFAVQEDWGLPTTFGLAAAAGVAATVIVMLSAPGRRTPRRSVRPES